MEDPGSWEDVHDLQMRLCDKACHLPTLLAMLARAVLGHTA